MFVLVLGHGSGTSPSLGSAPREGNPEIRTGRRDLRLTAGTLSPACRLFFLSFFTHRLLDLKLLHTDPKHQGRGAGGMLVRWGVEEARRRGVPAYLESSEAGHSLYRKYGFRDLELQSLDFSRWGATQKHNTWAMIYEPSSGP